MSVVGPIHLDIEITGRVPIEGELHTQVTVYLPDHDALERPVVLFAFPGGGAGRGMYCMEAATAPGYSHGRWHAERGIVFVACDHLGTGGSSHPDPEQLSSAYPLAWANQATVEVVLDLLARDAIVPGHGAVRHPVALGAGHSMGANLTIVLQANRAVFDGVAILGYSAIHTVLPTPDGVEPAAPPRRPREHPVNARDFGPPSPHSRAVHRYMSRWDDAEAAEIRSHEWELPLASPTMPPAAGHMNAAGVVTEEASWIEVPVFLGFGERDVTRDPWEEPRWYWRSRDVTLAVVPHMSHGMNAASTRVEMWERLHHWALGVASFGIPQGNARLTRTFGVDHQRTSDRRTE